tara:strand:+ start:1013 stop:1480 length:468 start_codon:yes stop_codon:yes gene_type:complete
MGTAEQSKEQKKAMPDSIAMERVKEIRKSIAFIQGSGHNVVASTTQLTAINKKLDDIESDVIEMVTDRQELEWSNSKLSSEIDELRVEVADLGSENMTLEKDNMFLDKNQYTQHLPEHHQNIRVESALEALFENFDAIGVEVIENLVQPYLNTTP